MKITVYSYGYDNDSGHGTCVFGKAAERDAALREAILSHIDDNHDQYASMNNAELYEAVAEWLNRDCVYFTWDDHVLDIDV